MSCLASRGCGDHRDLADGGRNRGYGRVLASFGHGMCCDGVGHSHGRLQSRSRIVDSRGRIGDCVVRSHARTHGALHLGADAGAVNPCIGKIPPSNLECVA